MQFFSGFSLKNEEYLFQNYLQKSDFCVAGFSYGAIKAYRFVEEKLQKAQRVDTLQLLSPAFFQNRDMKFKRLQLMAYKRDKARYLENFLASCFAPYGAKIVEHSQTRVEELEELLYYEWSLEALKKIVSAGVKVEIYLGGRDAIIDAKSAEAFFREVGTTTYIKEANHFLQLN